MKKCKKHKWCYPLITKTRTGQQLQAQDCYFLTEVLFCTVCRAIRAEKEHVGMMEFVRSYKKGVR